MNQTSKRSRTVTIVSAVTALAFLAAGTAKLLGAPPLVESFTHFGFGTGFMRFIGATEVAGAVGLFLPRLAPLAATGLVIIMGGAVVVHLLHDPMAEAVPPAVLLISCAFLAFSRRAELR
jgi:uncharacterized membrane protein YphA (DoxX/SURF4 family)